MSDVEISLRKHYRHNFRSAVEVRAVSRRYIQCFLGGAYPNWLPLSICRLEAEFSFGIRSEKVMREGVGMSVASIARLSSDTSL